MLGIVSCIKYRGALSEVAFTWGGAKRLALEAILAASAPKPTVRSNSPGSSWCDLPVTDTHLCL